MFLFIRDIRDIRGRRLRPLHVLHVRDHKRHLIIRARPDDAHRDHDSIGTFEIAEVVMFWNIPKRGLDLVGSSNNQAALLIEEDAMRHAASRCSFDHHD